jgi:hypothetical protein
LTMKSALKCVFDVDRSICNRCATLNAACLVVRLSYVCRLLFHDWSISDWFDFLCCDE